MQDTSPLVHDTDWTEQDIAVCAVDEDLSPGQDHIYVVFLLPVLEPGKHRGRGAWGADAAAASLMGLSGHSYAAKGAPPPRANPLCMFLSISSHSSTAAGLLWALQQQVPASSGLSGQLHAAILGCISPCIRCACCLRQPCAL